MPELVPLWEDMTELAEGGEEVARMLSLVDPTAYLAGCSQAVWGRRNPMLVRNYDYAPSASEYTFLLSSWHGTRVLASSDCLWGALDGMNEYGLCVALSFGGSPRVGKGFGIPLILRYVLEFCADLDDALTVLERVPSHMAYNVSLLDRRGEHAVVYMAPGHKPEVAREAITTNHQRRVEWSEYAEVTRSEERASFLQEAVARKLSSRRFVDLFLKPPLYANDHEHGYSTLYTVAYHPKRLAAEFLWPHSTVRQGLDDFAETELAVDLVGPRIRPGA